MPLIRDAPTRDAPTRNAPSRDDVRLGWPKDDQSVSWDDQMTRVFSDLIQSTSQ